MDSLDKSKFFKHCVMCNYKTIIPLDWIKHIKCEKHLHNSLSKITKCDKCDYNCINHLLLKRHMLTQHTTIGKKKRQKYHCNICNFIFF